MARRRSKKPRLICAFIILAIIVAFIAFAVLNIIKKDTNKEQNTTTPDPVVIADVNNEDVPATDDEPVKKDGITVVEANDPNTSSYVTGKISNFKFVNGKFRITVITDQALSEGTCNIKMASGASMAEANAEVVAHPNSSSCKFDLDNIKAGEWHIVVSVATTENRTGIIEDTIKVEK